MALARHNEIHTRRRADLLLVERGLFESRARAQAAIAAGLVKADGVVVAKPSDGIAANALLQAEAEHPWVSRGGVKLAAALDVFRIDPGGRVCLDVGASTGGFTEVLLARGAAHVYAVDVGHGQLHPRLRGRPDITLLEQTDIRALDPAKVSPKPELVTLDVSFISLRHVLAPAVDLASRSADLVALVKPQFEALRSEAKKGIVRDPAVHGRVCREAVALAEGLGCTVAGVISSPIAGGDGNQEFLLGARRRG